MNNLTYLKPLSLPVKSLVNPMWLLENAFEQYQYPIDGANEVVKPTYVCHPEQSEGSQGQTNNELTPPDEKRARNDEHVLGKVYINETQYFDNVPEIAWNFYIGGYQPVQKWLKDRKGRVLEFDDIYIIKR